MNTELPVGLSDGRSASGLAALANDPNAFGTSLTPANIDHTALALFNSPSLPGEPGKWLIPNDALHGAAPTAQHVDNAFIAGTGRSIADLAVADLDYNASTKDTLSSSTRSMYKTSPAPPASIFLEPRFLKIRAMTRSQQRVRPYYLPVAAPQARRTISTRARRVWAS